MLLTSDQSLCPGSRATDFINDDKYITLQKYEDLKHTLQTKQQRVCVCTRGKALIEVWYYPYCIDV